MKDIMRNKKGFTLVELLAVIVVLAIIILVAMPAVMSAMDKARRNSLTNEANELIRITQTAYSDDVMNSKVPAGKSYCYSIEWLKSNGFLEKNLTNYKGSVLLKATSGATEYKIYLSNGMYYFSGVEGDAIEASKLNPGKGEETLNTCNGQADTLRSAITNS